MYRHIKTNVAVNVGSPDARFGNVLLEQFGGANGELAAALAARGIRGKWKIVESPELEQGVEGHSGKTIAKNHKPAGEETGEAKTKKSA